MAANTKKNATSCFFDGVFVDDFNISVFANEMSTFDCIYSVLFSRYL